MVKQNVVVEAGNPGRRIRRFIVAKPLRGAKCRICREDVLVARGPGGTSSMRILCPTGTGSTGYTDCRVR